MSTCYCEHCFGPDATDRLNENAAELLIVLERAIPWLSKMIADNSHSGSVLPRDCEVTLARAEALVRKIKGEL